MEVLAKETDWLPTDSENLAAFLETATGKRLIPALVQGMPSLLAGGDVNAILIRSGEVKAFQSVVESIVLLAHPPAPLAPPNTEYPRLEDDKAWNDGQSLASETAPKKTPETK
jgi:hypothetical protein